MRTPTTRPAGQPRSCGSTSARPACAAEPSVGRLDPLMTRSERDLVLALRAELAAIDPSRPCDRHAEVAGLGDEVGAREPAGARPTVRLRRPPDTDTRPFDWDAAAEHCRTGWLRGRFLARGSLSLAGGRTHLEFVVAPDDAPVLAPRLREAGFPR